MVILTSLYKKAIERITAPGTTIIDVGGGLRAFKGRGDRFEEAQARWLVPLLDKCTYKILDPVDTYHPDIVGDIHALPFADNSQDAIVCLSVLEHIPDPALACREMHRVLKPGGAVFIHVPFLFYYHAEKGYYQDYWRFTEDSLRLILGQFSSVEVENARGALEAWVNLLPMGHYAVFRYPARFFDWLLHKQHSKQTDGFYALAIK